MCLGCHKDFPQERDYTNHTCSKKRFRDESVNSVAYQRKEDNTAAYKRSRELVVDEKRYNDFYQLAFEEKWCLPGKST